MEKEKNPFGKTRVFSAPESGPAEILQGEELEKARNELFELLKIKNSLKEREYLKEESWVKALAEASGATVDELIADFAKRDLKRNN